MNVLFTAILVNLIILGDSGDFDEPADSRKSYDLCDSVYNGNYGESNDCCKFSDKSGDSD